MLRPPMELSSHLFSCLLLLHVVDVDVDVDVDVVVVDMSRLSFPPRLT